LELGVQRTGEVARFKFLVDIDHQAGGDIGRGGDRHGSPWQSPAKISVSRPSRTEKSGRWRVRRRYSAVLVISPVESLTATMFSICASRATVSGSIVTLVLGLLL
jgi:hypothetical protein